jgi:hypothetical protein
LIWWVRRKFDLMLPRKIQIFNVYFAPMSRFIAWEKLCFSFFHLHVCISNYGTKKNSAPRTQRTRYKIREILIWKKEKITDLEIANGINSFRFSEDFNWNYRNLVSLINLRMENNWNLSFFPNINWCPFCLPKTKSIQKDFSKNCTNIFQINFLLLLYNIYISLNV